MVSSVNIQEAYLLSENTGREGTQLMEGRTRAPHPAGLRMGVRTHPITFKTRLAQLVSSALNRLVPLVGSPDIRSSSTEGVSWHR